jgi:nitrate reductase gamma subunit
MVVKNAADIPVKKGLGYMSLTGVLMFLAVLMFIAHEVFNEIPIHEYITVSLGWVLGSIAGVCIYIGYIAPKWLRDRWIRASQFNES